MDEVKSFDMGVAGSLTMIFFNPCHHAFIG